MMEPARLEHIRQAAVRSIAQDLDLRWPAATVLALLDRIAEVERQAEAHRCRCLGHAGRKQAT